MLMPPEEVRDVVKTDRSNEVRGFFLSRRARLSPDALGFGIEGQLRRVAGLRREEVAERAGISVEYYTRIERGALDGVSDAVLHALASALQLDTSEVAYLHQLARAGEPCAAEWEELTCEVSPGVRNVVESITEMPVFATNAQLDVLAVNALGQALYFDRSGSELSQTRGGGVPVNLARFCFEDPHAKRLYRNWHEVAQLTVSLLRVGRNSTVGGDNSMAALIGELSSVSDVFRREWEAFDVTRRFAGALEMVHPDTGVMRLQFEQFHPATHPGITVHVLSAERGSASFERLQRLASRLRATGDERTAPMVTSTASAWHTSPVSP